MRRALVSAIVSALVVGAAPAAALRDEPPSAHLRYRGDRIQRAHLAASCWPGKDGAVGCGETQPMTWPKVDRVTKGARLRVRIRWWREPKGVFVDSYRSIGRNGRPRDRGKDIRSTKRRRRIDGRTVWDVIFRLRATREHFVKVLIQRPHTVAWNIHVEVVD